VIVSHWYHQFAKWLLGKANNSGLSWRYWSNVSIFFGFERKSNPHIWMSWSGSQNKLSKFRNNKQLSDLQFEKSLKGL
jgi:hypothetical protein